MTKPLPPKSRDDATRTPRDFTAAEWADIRQRLAHGQTKTRIADDYGVKRTTLDSACMQRGLHSKAPPGTRDAALPQRVLRDAPALRKTLSAICREAGIDDPEAVLVAARDRYAEGIDAIEHRLLGGEDKYEGMPELGITGTRYTGDDRVARLAVHATEEEIGLRDLLALLKDLARIEAERMPYKQPKLSAAKVEHSGKVDFSGLTDEQLEAIARGDEPGPA